MSRKTHRLQEPMGSMLEVLRREYLAMAGEHDMRQYPELFAEAEVERQRAEDAGRRLQPTEALRHWMRASFYLGAAV